MSPFSRADADEGTEYSDEEENIASNTNANEGNSVPRQLVTGAHTVGDISCAQCGSVLGWKYVAAEEEAQRYKVGKFILETKRVCRTSTWESQDDNVNGNGRSGSVSSAKRLMPPGDISKANEVEFDSQDEDECEDLFLGVWTPHLAAKRRKQRAFARGND